MWTKEALIAFKECSLCQSEMSYVSEIFRCILSVKTPVSSVRSHHGVFSKKACKFLTVEGLIVLGVPGWTPVPPRLELCEPCHLSHSGRSKDRRSCVFFCVAGTGLLLQSSKCLVRCRACPQ